MPTVCFFFNDTATTEIYTLSLHDALPISWRQIAAMRKLIIYSACSEKVPRPHFFRYDPQAIQALEHYQFGQTFKGSFGRSEEHTSELQSRQYLVCRLLLEKKKKNRPC